MVYWYIHLQWQVFRQYATCQEFGIVFGRQWDIELRPVFRQEVDIRNIYSKVMWRVKCYRQALKTWKLCISGPIMI
jgi:hypothetical protein